MTLDFAGVEQIGRAFADELFRVSRLDHPGVAIRPVNASEEVTRTIRGALATLS